MSGQREPSSDVCEQSSGMCGPSYSIFNKMMCFSSSLDVDRKRPCSAPVSPEHSDKMENFNREGLIAVPDSSNDESESKSYSDGDQPDFPSVDWTLRGESSMPPSARLGYDWSNLPLLRYDLTKPITELGSPKSGFRLPLELCSNWVDARLDDKGTTSKDQWTRGADQPKVGDLSDSTTTEDDQSGDHIWISTKGHVEDHPSSKDTLPSEDLAQDRPSVFQPNSEEATSRFGAVGDGAKRANFTPPTIKMQPYGERPMNYQPHFEEEQGLGLSNLWVRVTAKSVWLDFALMNISQAEINEDGFTPFDVPDKCDQTLRNIWSLAEFEYNLFVRQMPLCLTRPEYLYPITDITDIMDSKLCLHYFLPKELEEDEIPEYGEYEDMETPTELGSTDL